MSGLEQIVKQLSEKALKDEHEKRIETIIKILSSLYDKATAYFNIIIAVGYAGFFAVWSMMKNHMSPTEMRLSAISILLSLSIFVFWEVAKMLLTSKNIHRLIEVINAPPSEFNERLKKQEYDEKMLNIKLIRAWRIVLVCTITPALFAGGVLSFSFISNLCVL